VVIVGVALLGLFISLVDFSLSAWVEKATDLFRGGF